MSVSNPFGRGFSVEAAIDRGRTKEARRARDAELEVRARETIRVALDGCTDGLRDDLALALIEAATVAAGSHHDPERIQAHLGKLAHENGAPIAGPAAGHRATAEALFARKGVA